MFLGRRRGRITIFGAISRKIGEQQVSIPRRISNVFQLNQHGKYTIVGMGNFGAFLAQRLTELGHEAHPVVD